jgi:hypothetical protein
MPETVADLEVHADRRGNGGYILFEIENSCAASMLSQPNRVQIEYGPGYARIGMGCRYTIAMLCQEFCALIGNDWSLHPGLAYQRLTHTTIRHHMVSEYSEITTAVTNNLIFELPEKHLEEAGRGTEGIFARTSSAF